MMMIVLINVSLSISHSYIIIIKNYNIEWLVRELKIEMMMIILRATKTKSYA